MRDMEERKNENGQSVMPESDAADLLNTGGDAPAAPPEGGGKKKKKKFQMPNAYVIVFLAMLVTLLLTWFVPSSVNNPETGEVVFNAILDSEGNIVENAGPQHAGLWDLLMAPVKGFQSASDVGIALLIAGGFLHVMSTTGALEAGFGKMLKRLRGNALIIMMMLVSSILGTVFGFWEEIVAFSIIVVPLFVYAGYDVMTGLGVLFIGSTAGNMASVVNPFSTGAAVASIGDPSLSLGSGLILRAILFVVLTGLGTIMMVQYAAKVKKNPQKSVLHGLEGVKTGGGETTELPEMTRPRFASVLVFIFIVLALLLGYTPWADIGGDAAFRIVNAPFTLLSKVPVLGGILATGHMTPFGEWGFDEFSWLFFFGALLLKFINRIKIQEFTTLFLTGAKDLLGVVLVLAMSRGIAVLMGNSTQGMSVTFVYWISSALSSAPLWIFAVVALLAYVGIGVFLQSTSGVAGISMPILGAVAAALFLASAIGSTGGEIILISAFTVGLNFTNCLYPSATNLGTIELFNVPFNAYLKFVLWFLIPLLLVGGVIISLAPYLGLAV